MFHVCYASYVIELAKFDSRTNRSFVMIRLMIHKESFDRRTEPSVGCNALLVIHYWNLIIFPLKSKVMDHS